MLLKKFMKIEFQNSIRRMSFLCRLADIKIGWINPGIFFRSFCRNTIDTLFPSYSGFCASITEPSGKHKAYFDVTLPTPPNKSTVYDVLERCRKAAEFKSGPFVQLVGDQPVYTLILEIKNENPVLFEKILPVLG